jgi:uncharacterized protein YqhQ
LNLRGFVRLFTHIQLLPVLENGEETTLIGGQAVMEGVMMRSPHGYCVAVRKPNGELVTEAHALPPLSDRLPIFKLPVLRGLGTLGQAMWLGMKALRFSATHAIQDETTTENGKNETKDVSSWAMGLNVLISVAFFLVMYKFVPLYLATLLGKTFPAVGGRFAINMVDGTVRIIIFLGFLYLMSRMKEIHRVFEYHGAEHRVVFNFESGQAVTVANAQRFDTWHPRCGTSFLVVVMVLSMAVYALLPFDGFLAKLVGRIALLPVVVGVSYELIRFAAKRRSSLLAMLTRPGLWLQRVTTQPPSNDQTEVAILALDQAMELEKEHGGVLVIA